MYSDIRQIVNFYLIIILKMKIMETKLYKKTKMTTVNIMIMGDAGVGKTSYINRLCTGDFEYRYEGNYYYKYET